MTFAFSIFDSFDLGAGTPGETIRERLELAVEAERLGFDHYHVTEHHGTNLSVVPSPNLFLAALSQRTMRIRMGTTVYVLPAYEPIRLAEEIAVLDQMTCGRLDLGVGRGISPYELAYFGVDAAESKPLYERARHAILQALETGELVHPEESDRPRATLSVQPVQSPYPPLWYASSNQASAQWAGANGVNFVGRWNSGDFIDAASVYWRAFRESDPERRLNRGLETPRVGTSGTVFIGASEQEAHERHAQFAQAGWERVVALWHEHGNHTVDSLMEPQAMLERGTAIVGTADSVREQILDQIERAEVNFFEAQLYKGDLTFEEALSNMRRFAEIMPSIRESAAARLDDRGLPLPL